MADPAELSDEDVFGAPQTPKEMTDEEVFGHQEMPGPFGALTSGLRHAGREWQQGAAVAAHQPVPPSASLGPEEAPIGWEDIGHPISQLLPKAIYGLASGAPMLAAGVATGAAASALYGGPETPAGAVAGLVGGAIGAGATSAAQAIGPKMAAELLKTPEDVNGAFERALMQAGQEGVFSGVGWAAFGFGPFKNKVKDLLFQAFAIQPAVAEAQVATQNIQAGKPATEGMLEAYPGAVAGTLLPMLGAEGARLGARGIQRAFRGPEAAAGEPVEPGVQPPSPISPEALQGTQATIERYRPVEPVRIRPPVRETARAKPEDTNILGGERPVDERAHLRSMIDSGAPLDDLIAHPFVQRAIEHVSKTVPTGTAEDFADPGWWNKRVYNFGTEAKPDLVQGREAAIPRLVEGAKAFSTDGPVENGRHAILVLGPPASGKSTLSEPFARRYRAAIVDADEAKQVIPEYANGVGTQAVHEESSELSGEVLNELMFEGANIVLPKVGDNPDKMRSQINKLKEAGYTVDIAHVASTPEIAGRRNISRLLNTGRLVPPKYISEVGDKPRRTAYMLKGEANDFLDADTSASGRPPPPPRILEGTGPLADALRDDRNGGQRPSAGDGQGNRETAGGRETPAQALQPHRVTAADGTAIDVAPRVVEARAVRTSQDAGYDPALQPRQRSRAASQAQVRDIATNLDPERLGYSAEADRGAPIVGPDGMVESGNGRVLALRSVYDRGGPQADAYRAWLAKQGVDVAAFRQPVLVRQRTTPLTPEARRAFTVAANQASTLAMSAPERAMADARLIDGRMLGLIRNPDDLASAGNRDFIRRFVASLPQSEQGMIADARGGLSAEGLMRVRNALLAKAYDDPGILARIAESTDDEVKSISNALTAAAPAWAKLRGAISEGRVRPDMDATPFLLEAVKRTVDLRGKGEKLDAYLAQQDAFNKVSKPVEDIMRMFYDPKERQAASARRISDALKFYADEADKVSVDPGLGLGLVPLASADILQRAKEKHYEGYRTELPDRYGAGNGQNAEAARRQERGSFLGAPGEGTARPGDFGDQEAAVSAQRPERLTSQLAFPGTEPISQAEVAKRRGAEPLRPKKPQLPPDMGLFGYEGTQPSLNLEGTNAPAPAQAAVRPDTGRQLGAAAPQVPAGKSAGRTSRAKQVWRPQELSLFDWGGGREPVQHPDVAVPGQPGGQEAPLPGTGTSVTGPPMGSGGDREGRNDLPAPEADGVSEAQKKIEERSRSNYRITDANQIGAGGKKEKARGNIEAIRVLKQIEDEARDATPEEKAVLVKYVGWGSIAQEMFETSRWSRHADAWKNEREALQSLLTDEEYDSAKASTPNAHYTSPDVVSGMWDAMAHLGYDGGMALEPAAGVGHFLGLIPDAVAPKTAWAAVELDSITGRIAKKLYGGAEVAVHGFEELKRPSNYYDLAISNVPFGDYNISERPYGSFPIHDFFFVKSLDKVRPGGIVAFITSRYTMDRIEPETRRLLAKTSDLVGAIRLPGGDNGAFAQNAGTQVTTDVLFLRKKVPGETFRSGAKWDELKEVQTPEGPTKINEYFAANPHMMMGEMRLMGTQYRANEPVLIGDAEGLRERVAMAAKSMPAGAFLTKDSPPPPPVHATEIAEGTKDGAFFLKDGKLYQRREGAGHAHLLAPDQHDRVVQLMGIRDIYNDLLQAQLRPEEAKHSPELLRHSLRDAYQAFVNKYGPINKEVRTVTKRLNKAGEPVVTVRHPNRAVFADDPDSWKVASIENYDSDADKATPADIQNKDVIRPRMERQINGPSDALAASLDAKGEIDLDHIAQSLNLRSQDQVVHALGDLAYQNPDGRKWETADAYLSGNVVKKLEDAREIAKEDASYLRNVAALEKVQPEPLVGSQITAQFGAPWVPPEVYKDFLTEIGGHNVKVSRVPLMGEWKLSALSFSRDAEMKYGTDRKEVGEIALAAMNNQTPVVWDKGPDDTRVKNAVESEKARVKVDLLKEAFTGDPEKGVDGWVWGDPERSQLLEGIYNRTYNNLVNRKFDGSHLTLPGINPDFATRQHRKDAVWRVIQNGNTLLAHVVGSGKTATMMAAAMEQKRLGLINKPMMVVPNHLLEQFSREFIQTYPNAKVLVAEKDEMTREKRKAFIAKVASNDWDGVVITHDAFGRINMSDEYRRSHIQDQLDELERIIRAEEHEDKKSPTVKTLEKMKKKLREKLTNLMNEGRKDSGASFEESGVDFIFVDEAHFFKNLARVSRMQNIKGLSQGDSQRAEDLYIKLRYLDQSRPGRSAVFATGTPISNAMAEMWTMQRYLQLDRLKEANLDTFDNWANTFGRVVNNTELSADGRTFKDVSSFSRFVNVPELISLYSEIADTQTADMLKLPRPKSRTTIVTAEPSDQEERHIQALVDLAESLKGKRPEKGQPNMLSVVTAGRKVATDGRLISGDFDFNPQGKIAKAVNNISRIYREGNKDPSAPDKVQMVFLDMGVPQTRGGRKVLVDDGDVADPAAVEMPRMNLYADLKQRLVDAGVPAHEIAFIHDATDDQKKARLFERVRQGDVRVLVGSTGKMGMGTNVQDRLIAVHHLDAPWKPAEVEQRDGRIVRQGNKNPEVQIYRYVTKRSFDAFMWQKLDTKAKFVGQVQSGARGSRTMEDIDNPLPEAAEMKAAASGDPRIMEHAELGRQVRALTGQKRAFESTKSRATWEVGAAKSRIQQYETALPTAHADAAKVQDIAGKNFQVDFGGAPVTDRVTVGKAIIERILAMDDSVFYTPKVLQVGRMSGFDMQIQVRKGYAHDGTVLRADLSLRGDGAYASPNDTVINPQTDPAGLVRRFENILGNIKTQPERLQSQLDSERTSLTKLEKTLTDTWPKEKDYRETLAKLNDLTQALKAPKHPDVHEEEVKARRANGPTQEDYGPRPGERVVPIGRQTVAHVSDKYTEAEQKIADAVHAIGKRMAPQAQVAGVKALRQGGDPIWGAFIDSPTFPHLIAWSLEKGGGGEHLNAYANTVRHEIIHHLKRAGLIRPKEWNALADTAISAGWLDKHRINERYGDLSEAQKVEEAIAEQFGAWRFDREVLNGIKDPVRRVIMQAFHRLDLFLKQVAAAARQFMGRNATASDVFSRIESGEVGQRPKQRASGGRVRAEKALPPDHELGMRVPEGGSRCGNCRFLASDTTCGNERFVKWNGTATLPAPKNEYCCDLYERHKELADGGCVEGKMPKIGPIKVKMEGVKKVEYVEIGD